ncbi:DegT/DnrJ/EryC1/StrS aminotransferase family protein [uncultured Alsobacter sp.]|uniref:DegT/DnrJ/EryC1/StrS family aminotransferase n=1 Tax=uncultured Alsobacter sp. TaxID=1748258 RepID=UPI0025D70A4D|nr:DegT/DnrJ/EryC1/StrS aminotransferase family protein [uncultured Alsobacter sp.]
MNAPAAPEPIAFIDLAAQKQRIGPAVEAAIKRVLDHGQYIMGPEVKTFEAQLGAFCGATHVVSCASGTDALALVLMAKGVKPGDAVICPTFTFCATAEVVAWLGATPIFVDSTPDTFNIDPASLRQALETARSLGLRPVGIIPVDLFGLAADYAAIVAMAEAEGLWVLSDAAQSFGASVHGRKVGTFGLATATSFFPAKPLGCYGDGGAILTEDAELAALMRSLRVHGQGSDKYDNVRIGMTARLDTIQAAILIEKLAVFADEIEARNRVAARYNAALADVCQVPFVPDGHVSVWAQYTILVPGDRRDAIAATLKSAGVPTAVYYPMPLHKQVAYRHYPVAGNGLPVSEDLSRRVLSLPMHPYLDEATQDRVVEAVRAAVA